MKKGIARVLLIIALCLIATTVIASAQGKTGGDDIRITAAKGLATVGAACVFGMALAAVGAAIGQSLAARAALEGTARQPEASGKLQIQMIIAVIFIETLAIYTLVIALILLFINPLSGLIK